MSIKISAFCFNPFGEITYVIWDPESLDAAVIDPGMISKEECDKIDSFISNHKLKVTHLINTHLHLDHIFGAHHISEKYGVGVEASEADAPLGQSLKRQMERFGMRTNASPVEVTHALADGDTIKFGTETLHVIAVPGHSPGSIALYSPSNGYVMVGDTLFKGGIGRTDLEGGSQKEIEQSITKRLFTLPDDTLVCPGHGPTTTIGYEKAHNPYVR